MIPLRRSAASRPLREAIAPEASLGIVVPIPGNAPSTPAHRLGKPTATWRYMDTNGALLGYVHRFDGDGDKQFRPQTLWRNDTGGALEWRWKSWPAPRPLYGLDLLAATPTAPVVITEGEKARDAARRLLPAGFVAITSPNGSKSAKKTARMRNPHGYSVSDDSTAGFLFERNSFKKDASRSDTMSRSHSSCVSPNPASGAARCE